MSFKLVEAISIGDISLSEIEKDELKSLIKYSINNSDYRALTLISDSVTGIFNNEDFKRNWLNSPFSANVWEIKLKIQNNKTRAFKIEWNKVFLDDSSNLTDNKNKILLNSFKHWILSIDDPLNNGGKLLKEKTVYGNINATLTLINAILLNGSKLNISTKQLDNINEDFIIAIFIKLAIGKIDSGLYEYPKLTKKLLLDKIKKISDEESDSYKKLNPFISRFIPKEDMKLNLSLSERIKSCCWLETVGYYRSGKNNENVLKGNNNVLLKFVYKDNILPVEASVFPLFEELKLAIDKRITEYQPMPNKNSFESLSINGISRYFIPIKALTSINKKSNTCHINPEIFKNLSIKRIKNHVNLPNAGRTKTLPPVLVFNLMRNCFEFPIKFQDDILTSIFNLIKDGIKKDPYSSVTRTINDVKVNISSRSYWVRVEAIKLVEPSLIKLGVKELTTKFTDKDRFIKRRKNHAVSDLYTILIGSLQVLIGSLMAKRQGEILDLKPHSNLYPNINPSSETGKKTEFMLIATVKKTGHLDQNEIIQRPIPHSIANMIWKLEKFNSNIIENSLNKGKLALFNNLQISTLTFSKLTSRTYDANLDMVCDYFETPLVSSEYGELLRYYVRQHQLRRFFAMVFFWSKGYNGLDTLRWMMGHSDIEHLYHYISESDTGDVLNGVKASYLTDALQKNTLDNIDALADSLSKRFCVAKENISMSTIKNAVIDYEDDFQTFPTIKQLEEQATRETQILELLIDGTITLEPEFFTFSDGKKLISDFSLILKVNEIN